MSSTKTSSLRRELPFAAKLAALCLFSATLGAVIAAYQADGNLNGLQRTAARHLATARRVLAPAAPEPLFADADFLNQPYTINGFETDESEPATTEDEEEELEATDVDPDDVRRQLAGWPNCPAAKNQAACRQRAMDLQAACSWRNGRCKYRPGATVPQPPPLEGFTLAPTPAPQGIQDCIADVSTCPMYPEGRLLYDWPRRFGPGAICAPERNFYNTRCLDVCNRLFNSYSETVLWGDSIMKSCSIGCMYAKNMFQKKLPKSTCHADCKNTVWHFEASAGKCRYPYGLNIAVTDVLHPEFMGAGKACEIGCLAGNDRPCPALNLALGRPLTS